MTASALPAVGPSGRRSIDPKRASRSTPWSLGRRAAQMRDRVRTSRRSGDSIGHFSAHGAVPSPGDPAQTK
jgi:hypothetical protein